jgi:hypothetical protein
MECFPFMGSLPSHGKTSHIREVPTNMRILPTYGKSSHRLDVFPYLGRIMMSGESYHICGKAYHVQVYTCEGTMETCVRNVKCMRDHTNTQLSCRRNSLPAKARSNLMWAQRVMHEEPRECKINNECAPKVNCISRDAMFFCLRFSIQPTQLTSEWASQGTIQTHQRPTAMNDLHLMFSMQTNAKNLVCPIVASHNTVRTRRNDPKDSDSSLT